MVNLHPQCNVSILINHTYIYVGKYITAESRKGNLPKLLQNQVKLRSKCFIQNVAKKEEKERINAMQLLYSYEG